MALPRHGPLAPYPGEPGELGTSSRNKAFQAWKGEENRAAIFIAMIFVVWGMDTVYSIRTTNSLFFSCFRFSHRDEKSCFWLETISFCPS
jgi:hypothetical protein